MEPSSTAHTKPPLIQGFMMMIIAHVPRAKINRQSTKNITRIAKKRTYVN